MRINVVLLCLSLIYCPPSIWAQSHQSYSEGGNFIWGPHEQGAFPSLFAASWPVNLTGHKTCGFYRAWSSRFFLSRPQILLESRGQCDLDRSLPYLDPSDFHVQIHRNSFVSFTEVIVHWGILVHGGGQVGREAGTEAGLSSWWGTMLCWIHLILKARANLGALLSGEDCVWEGRKGW